MKYLHKYFIALLLVFTTLSCDEKLSDLIVDPDSITKANDSEVLTAAQGYMGIIQEVDLNGFSQLWAQYFTWGIGVALGNQERYVSASADKDAYWQRAYANVLADLKYLGKSDKAAYRGVSKVLSSYVFQGLVDHFGDVPYSEALNGEIADGAILTPKFDGAAEIYSALLTNLDEGIAELEVASAGDISGDLVFNGDLNKWIRFANSLKLRILMRTSESSPKGAEIVALINSGIFLESATEVAEIKWPGVINNQNPLYSTRQSGVGEFYFASNATLNVLRALGDPRRNIIYKTGTSATNADGLLGIEQGAVDRDVPFTSTASQYSLASSFTNGPASPTVFMSPWEVWFLRAEAAARYATSDNEKVAFENAISANFSYMGVSGAAAYITNLDYSTSAALDSRIDMIAVQKWISFNGTQEDEGWIETRRFDRPASRLFSNSTSGIFQTPVPSVLGPGVHPASWLYPQSELSFNAANAPAQRAITDKLFWDN